MNGGLTLDRMGADLTRQLYTALSRIRNRQHGMALLPQQESNTPNVTVILRIVGISEFGSLGVSTPHLVMVLFGTFLVYSVAIFVVTPHSFVTLHHHELVALSLYRKFLQELLD